jgi:hypothetical protein
LKGKEDFHGLGSGDIKRETQPVTAISGFSHHECNYFISLSMDAIHVHKDGTGGRKPADYMVTKASYIHELRHDVVRISLCTLLHE